MGALTHGLREFLDANRVGVLATQAASGRPRQSVVYYVRDGDELLITTLAGRLKTSDVQRTGWASLNVRGPDAPYPSATFAGPAKIRTGQIGIPTAKVMQRITEAPEPPKPQTDEALADLGRVILSITVEHVAAITHLRSE